MLPERPTKLPPLRKPSDKKLDADVTRRWTDDASKVLDRNLSDLYIEGHRQRGPEDIADDAIRSNHILDGEVKTADIDNLAVTTGKVADAAITTPKIADLNVTTAKLPDFAVTQQKIAPLAVTNGKLAGSISFDKLIETDRPGAFIYRNSNQSIPNNAGTFMTFTTMSRNVGAFWNAGLPTRLTIPTSAWYAVGFQGIWAANSTGQRYALLVVNGTVSLCFDVRQPVATFGTSHNLVSFFLFTAGDFLELQLFQNSGGALNFLGFTGAQTYGPFFWVMRLG
jgi:hypothetical protein